MPLTDPIVFIVDDDVAVRDALTLMIEQENIQVKAFASGEDFLASYEQECYSCVLLDVGMPGMDGLQVQTELSKREFLLPIIFLTGHGNIPMSVRAIKAGAVDFLTKPITREKLFATINTALLASQKILTKLANNYQHKAYLAELTAREREVMELAITGYPNKRIARNLGISHRTVEIHKSKIMHKTGARNLLELLRIAHEAGVTGANMAMNPGDDSVN